jgi:DNA replication protein DnaC
MNITVNIEAPELAKAINNLAIAFEGAKIGQVAPTTAVETKKKAEEPKKEAPKSEEPKVEEPKQEAAVKEEEEKPMITLETVRTKLASLSQSGKQAQVKALITSFDAKKLTDIPKEKYAELLEKAEDIK